MKIRTGPAALTALVLAACALLYVSTHINKLSAECVKVPPMRACTVSDKVDLGAWDDVYSVDDMDFMILRRGADVFSLSLTKFPKPKKLLTLPEMASSKIISAAHCGKRIWVFCQSKGSSPFAIDIMSCKKVTLEIPGLKVPEDATPSIEPLNITPYATAMLRISGNTGSQSSQSHIRYYHANIWFDLRSGKTIRLPSEWNMCYFSADQSIAVYGKPQEKAALNTKTGTLIEKIPDQQDHFLIPYDWSSQGEYYSRKPNYWLNATYTNNVTRTFVNGKLY